MAPFVISIANRKGGTAKTTTAVNVAACLAKQGLSTLLIDTDTLGHAGLMLGKQALKAELSIHALLVDPNIAPTDAIYTTAVPKLDIICADRTRAPGSMPAPPTALRDLLGHQDLGLRYDVVVIDTSPAYNEEMVMALAASQAVLTPFLPHPLALEGIRQLSRILLMIKTRLNPALKHFGLVAVQVNPRSRLHLDVVDMVQNEFGAERLVGSIRNDIRIPKCSLNTSINLGLATASNGVRDYSDLGDTLLHRWIPSITKAAAQNASSLTPHSTSQP